MIIATDYKILCHNKIYYVYNHQEPLCPTCNIPLNVRDSRKRNMITDSGESLPFRLRRLRCPKCHSVHIELPDIMEPHKHYSLDVITQTVNGTRNDCPADDSTIYRWKSSNNRNTRT